MPDDVHDEADEIRDEEIAADRAERRMWTHWAQRAAAWVLVVLGLLALGRGALDLLPLLQGLVP